MTWQAYLKVKDGKDKDKKPLKEFKLSLRQDGVLLGRPDQKGEWILLLKAVDGYLNNWPKCLPGEKECFHEIPFKVK